MPTGVSIGIHFDKPEPKYAPGEKVTGKVTVRSGKARQHDGLFLTSEWRTHGRGNPASGGLSDGCAASAKRCPMVRRMLSSDRPRSAGRLKGIGSAKRQTPAPGTHT